MYKSGWRVRKSKIWIPPQRFRKRVFDVVNCKRDATYSSVVDQVGCSGRGAAGAMFELVISGHMLRQVRESLVVSLQVILCSI